MLHGLIPFPFFFRLGTRFSLSIANTIANTMQAASSPKFSVTLREKLRRIKEVVMRTLDLVRLVGPASRCSVFASFSLAQLANKKDSVSQDPWRQTVYFRMSLVNFNKRKLFVFQLSRFLLNN